MPHDDQNIIDVIIASKTLDEETSFAFSKLCGALLYSDDANNNEQGRRIIIYVLDNWSKIPGSHAQIWRDLLESAGFYPYMEKSDLKSDNTLSAAQFLRKAYHSSEYLQDQSIYFHEEQKHLSNLLDAGKNVIVSAPTSFGKSLLIEDIVASKKFRNIVIIQPTLALLDETRKKLKKYKDDYKIIVKTSQPVSQDKGNLFLLTAERVMEYRDLPAIDFFVLDEFYKLSAKRDDERSDVLNNAFRFLIRHNAQFYLLGPNIDGISDGFAEKYNAVFIKTNYSLVENQVVDVYAAHKDIFDRTTHPKKKGYREATDYRENVLFELLEELKDEQTIIYCSSSERARKLANKFAHYLRAKGFKESETLNIIEWISENISSEWSVIGCLRLGIGIHDGVLPKHMTSTIIDYFNSKKLHCLFCTSTIIEGVNTSAKNIIYFDSKKGGKSIDYFDYSNIKGRSGRMMIHYVGKIYNFNPPPTRGNVVIDIPFYEQNPISLEVLIHLDEEEVRNKESSDYQNIQTILPAEKEIIKKNGLLVTGQQKVLEILKKDIRIKKELIIWHGMPKYDQLEYALTLAWENLLKPSESIRPFTPKQMAFFTFYYGNNKSISHLIQNRFVDLQMRDKYKDLPRGEVLDEAIRIAFQIMKHWFGYKIPKMLLTIDSLQKYVAALNGLEAGNYSFYAGQIENDFIQPNLVILNEYGVPRSAIDKLTKFIHPDWNDEQVLGVVRNLTIGHKDKFINYEIEKINDAL